MTVSIEDNMKIGILTFNFAQNYGAALQCYALSKILINLGADVSVMDYEPKYQRTGNAVFNNPLEVLKHEIPSNEKVVVFLKSIILNARIPGKVLKKCRFYEFRKEYINETALLKTQEDVLMAANDFDCIIVGSDQIWCKYLTGGSVDYVYFLKNVKCKKYTYAASAGSKFESADVQNAIVLLKDFVEVSLRENTLLSQLIDEGIDNVRLDLDPTLLLCGNEWSKLANRSKLKWTRKFILFYSLEKSDDVCEAARKMQEYTGMMIIDISPINCLSNSGLTVKKSKWISPIDFLWYIQNASYVVTNSFHGNVFALLFGKPLVSVLNMSSPERVLSLFNLLGIEQYLYRDNEELRDCIYYGCKSADEIITSYRNNSLSYLKKIVDGGEDK